jgi:hypothetical protein
MMPAEVEEFPLFSAADCLLDDFGRRLVNVRHWDVRIGHGPDGCHVPADALGLQFGGFLRKKVATAADKGHSGHSQRPEQCSVAVDFLVPGAHIPGVNVEILLFWCATYRRGRLLRCKNTLPQTTTSHNALIGAPITIKLIYIRFRPDNAELAACPASLASIPAQGEVSSALHRPFNLPDVTTLLFYAAICSVS